MRQKPLTFDPQLGSLLWFAIFFTFLPSCISFRMNSTSEWLIRMGRDSYKSPGGGRCSSIHTDTHTDAHTHTHTDADTQTQSDVNLVRSACVHWSIGAMEHGMALPVTVLLCIPVLHYTVLKSGEESKKEGIGRGTRSAFAFLFFQLIDLPNLTMHVTSAYFCLLRDDRLPKYGCFFGKVPKGGGGHFRSKKLHCRFCWFQSGIY